MRKTSKEKTFGTEWRLSRSDQLSNRLITSGRKNLLLKRLFTNSEDLNSSSLETFNLEKQKDYLKRFLQARIVVFMLKALYRLFRLFSEKANFFVPVEVYLSTQ